MAGSVPAVKVLPLLNITAKIVEEHGNPARKKRDTRLRTAAVIMVRQNGILPAE